MNDHNFKRNIIIDAFPRTEKISDDFTAKTQKLLSYIDNIYSEGILGKDQNALNLVEKMRQAGEVDKKKMDKQFDAVFQDNISSAEPSDTETESSSAESDKHTSDENIV